MASHVVEASEPDQTPFFLGHGRQLPGPFAPLVRNAWYVVAESKDVGRSLRSVTVLGEPLVFYRTEKGEPVVLDDRCAHRRFPLSQSHLKGDAIRCGYHGFTYDSAGNCIFMPGTSARPRFGIRKYPATERGPWLWVWMGEDMSRADPNTIPLPARVEFMNDAIIGYTYNPCNYMLLIENLLDLTHLHYLHGPHVVDELYANTPPDSLDLGPDNVGWHKTVDATQHGISALWCGEDPLRVIRRVEELRTMGPSLTYADQYFFSDFEGLKPSRSRIIHAITPKNLTETHQFWSFTLDAPLVFPVAQIADIFHKQIFSQDVDALGLQQNAILNDNRATVVEHSIKTDRFAFNMRKILRRLAA